MTDVLDCPDNAHDAARWKRGYDDAVMWLPTAKPEELKEMLAGAGRALESRPGSVFIHAEHSLAAYWDVQAGRLSKRGEVVGDINPDDNGYGHGFYSALLDLENYR
jgi:hypothetical protein